MTRAFAKHSLTFASAAPTVVARLETADAAESNEPAAAADEEPWTFAAKAAAAQALAAAAKVVAEQPLTAAAKVAAQQALAAVAKPAP